MSLRPQPVPPVPEETARVARAAFPDGSIYMLLRDEVGPLAADQDFTALFPTHGLPVHRALVGPRGGRRRQKPHRLEVHPLAGVDRPRLRQLCPVRVPSAPHLGPCGATAVGQAA